ncbi:hypothetical protein V2J52_05690 [Georgenia sp. MJ173]|uniref:hypothetical protein n=1 Tax=Georgenia sunbinii TaxID=3117728 RepID=UPI002F26A7D6
MTERTEPGVGRPPAVEDEGATSARLRRRRLLLGWSSPVVLAAMVAGCLLLGTAFGNLLGRQDYEAMRYSQAATQFQLQQRWTGFTEPWKAWFNSGTAHYRAEEYFLATEDLRVALVAVPVAAPLDGAPADTKDPQSPECRVRTNLSVAIEAMGDEAAELDDPAMAAAQYAEAREVIDPCTAMQENEETSDRQQDKEDQAREDEQEQRDEPSAEPSDAPSEEPSDEPTDPGEDPTDDPSDAPSDDPSEEPGDEPTETPEPTDDPQREELEERNREAERDRQEEQQRGGGGSGGGQNW